MDDGILQRFLDEEGRLKVWPSKPSHKEMVLAYLASKFRANQTYNEKQVNETIKEWHTFTDWSLLRRELVNRGFMTRDRNGYEYKLTDRYVNHG
jgi:hypothetical protein